MDDLLAGFMIGTGARLTEAFAALARLRAAPDRPDALALLRRHLHGIRDVAGCLGLPRMERLAHVADGALTATGGDALDKAEDALAGIARIVAALMADAVPAAPAEPGSASKPPGPGCPLLPRNSPHGSASVSS